VVCKCKKNEKNILLVEGKNDCHAIMSLCEKHKVTDNLFCIHDCESDEKVLKELTARLQAASELRPDVLGIVLDADKPEDKPSLESRIQAVTDRLRKVCSDYPAFLKRKPEGIIIPNPPLFPRIGIWLMPNNQDIGMLEDFLMQLARAKQATDACNYPSSIAYAETCVQQAQSQNLTSFNPVHESKAIIHTYLAWHEEPGTPLGRSITNHTLEPNTELAHLFTTWLKNLFS